MNNGLFLILLHDVFHGGHNCILHLFQHFFWIEECTGGWLIGCMCHIVPPELVVLELGMWTGLEVEWMPADEMGGAVEGVGNGIELETPVVG